MRVAQILSFAFGGQPAFESPFPVNRWELLKALKWEALWVEIGGLGRALVLGAIALGLVALVWGVVVLLRKLGTRGRRHLLWAATVALTGTSIALLREARSLPTGYFRLEDQLARGGAALSLTALILCVLALLTPWVFDLVERLGGFVGFVSVRQVRAGKSGVLTVISVLSIGGVAVSSFAMCAVVSIMGGFGADLKSKILDNNAHITIDTTKYGGIDLWDKILDEARLVPGVHAATAMASGEVMASSRSNTAGVVMRGIDAESFGSVLKIVDKIEVGNFDYLTHSDKLLDLPENEVIWIGKNGTRHLSGPRIVPRETQELEPEVAAVVERDDAYPGIILGKELARSLHVYVGEEVTLVAPLGELGPAGPMPKSQLFRVAAVFNTRMYEYDATQAYISINEAQKFLDLDGRVTSVEVRLDDPERTDEVTQQIKDVLATAHLGQARAADADSEGAPAAAPGLRIRNWQELNRNLFSALHLEKIVTYIILAIAIVVASFCIVCTLLLMVTEKRKEIAILKSLGASDGDVLRTFLTEGLLIGAVGTVFGVVTAAIACVALKQLGVGLDPDIWYVEQLPVEVNAFEYLFIASASLLITLLATIYPAVAASRLRPVDGIRYE